MKRLELKQTIYEWVTTYPELRDVLADFGFTPVKNNMMLQTAGKLMTVDRGLKHIGRTAEELNQTLAPYGFQIEEEPNEKSEAGAEERSADTGDVPQDREAAQREKMDRLKDLLLRLHAGEDEEVIKQDFKTHFGQVTPLEIATLERKLMAEEGISVEEVMRLCNVHVAIMGETDVDRTNYPSDFDHPGHPTSVMRQENLGIEAALLRVGNLVDAYVKDPAPEIKEGLTLQLEQLARIDRHYRRKEELIFPIMERYRIEGPPQVMWGVDDEIRALLRRLPALLENEELAELTDVFGEARMEIQGMINKEENILLPMVSDVFNEDDWLEVAAEMAEVGYAFITPPPVWEPERKNFSKKDVPNKLEPGVNAEDISANQGEEAVLKVGPGYLTSEELELILNRLPLELTFVDAEDRVKYFNEGTEEKLLARTRTAIGRDVMNCHPPRVHETVSALIADLKSGKKSEQTVWFNMRGKKVMITYAALRDEAGTYRGILEWVQDITDIVDLTGENRDVHR